MVNNAEQTATSAEKSTSNGVGMCLQWSRERAAIGSKYPDATTAWKNTTAVRHPGDRNPPRGACVYWTGGSKGYGHIAISLGNGMVRSSDAAGAGRPATVSLGWVESHWGLPYAGWADNVNNVTIPDVGSSGGGGSNEEDEMPQYDHGVANKALKIKANGWQAITWQKSVSGPAIKAGDNVAKLGGRRYTAVLKVNVDAPTGATIRLQCVEMASGEVQETNPQTEVVATAGATYGEQVNIGVVKAGRNLRWRITCTSDATLTSADVTVLSWG